MLLFENDGVVPLEAFTTFGMSAKPGSTNPIGKFGTGLKYAVAITLRLGGTFRLFRGEEEYVFYTKDEDFRGKTFAKVRMKRRRGVLSAWRYEALPFTTELGKHWEPWMAVRELEANVRDEQNGTSTTIGTEGPLQYLPREDRTVIVVDCDAMEEAYSKLDDIFLPEREVLFEDDNVRIFDGPSDHVFYRGMRVTDLRKPSLFTYEMKHVMLTEDRTSQYPFVDNMRMKQSLLACPSNAMVKYVVDNAEGHHEGTFDWDDKAPKASHAWYPALSRGTVTGRFASLRDNLHYGLGKSEDVEISLEVRQWEGILPILKAAGTDVYDEIREQLLAAGWKEPVIDPADLEEVADAGIVDYG